METKNRIFLSKPDITGLEKSFVMEALESGWVSSVGPDLDAFETELCEVSQRHYSVAVSSGTAALHLSLLSLGVEAGDVVFCPTMTFVATANAISYVGATPVFVDVDPASGNMSPDILRTAMKSFRASGQSLGAVLPVDLFGKMANYPELLDISEEFGVPIVSDSAESLGSSLSGVPAGKYGRVAVFSFNGNKIATTSGGGAIVSDDQELVDRARYLATQAREATIHYEHKEIGYNYRLSNILAAMGRAQLSRLPQFVNKRRENRKRYFEALGGLAGVNFLGGLGEEDNCWLTAVTVDSSETGWNVKDLQRHLAGDDIESRPLWKPMHLQQMYGGHQAFLDGTAEKLFEEGIALPSGSSLSDEDWLRIEESIQSFLGH